MIPLRVLGDRVLVALEPKETQVEASTGMNYREEQRTASGIILAAPSAHVDLEVQTRGVVVALGEKSDSVSTDAVWQAIDEAAVVEGDEPAVTLCQRPADVVRNLCALAPVPFSVQLGDCVLFPAGAGQSLPYDGVEYVVLKESEILGVLEPVNATAEVV